MSATVRQATARDAAAWIDLLRAGLAGDYPNPAVYHPTWVAEQLAPPRGHETWVATEAGRVVAAISLLNPFLPNNNPIANLGRNVFRPESYAQGGAAALLRQINHLAAERQQIAVARVPASDVAQQGLFEQHGYACVGYQPFKHLLDRREGVLFYVRIGQPDAVRRQVLSESLPQVHELALSTLAQLRLEPPQSVRDGATGYPLQSELSVAEVTFAEYRDARSAAESANPPPEISGGFNIGWGLLRVPVPDQVKALLGRRGSRVVAGLAYDFDEQDRGLRLIDGFAVDDLSTGVLLQRTVQLAQETHNAVLVEADALVTAPRLLKTAEQLGFVPVAYLPAFYVRGSCQTDVVKLVKLNVPFLAESAPLTTQARAVADIVDRNFQDQKVGVAIINLLRVLPIFEGLGDGELRKIARLFTQKLYPKGTRVFHRGDSGSEAYIVMRGQVDIQLEEGAAPVASLGNGQIFGELAFLDGSPRTAMASAVHPSILLVVTRVAFSELVQREPHLGLVVMRNIALGLSSRLRRANAALLAGLKR